MLLEIPPFGAVGFWRKKIGFYNFRAHYLLCHFIDVCGLN